MRGGWGGTEGFEGGGGILRGVGRVGRGPAENFLNVPLGVHNFPLKYCNVHLNLALVL